MCLWQLLLQQQLLLLLLHLVMQYEIHGEFGGEQHKGNNNRKTLPNFPSFASSALHQERCNHGMMRLEFAESHMKTEVEREKK